MANFGVFPLSTALLTGQTATTSGTSANLTLPMGQCYRLTVELLTASSTTTNFNVAVFSSSDGGTVYHGILNSTTMTTSGQGAGTIVRPYLGVGDTATSYTSPILGTADFAAPLSQNGPFDPRFVKLRWVVATTGTVTFNVKLDVVPQDLSD